MELLDPNPSPRLDPGWYDFHCHLGTDPSINHWNRQILVASQSHEWNFLANLIPDHPRSPIMMGLHPWFIDADFTDNLAQLELYLRTFPQIQIGEIGLDRCCPTPFELQFQVLEAQLQIAQDLKRNIALHCVKYESKIRDLLNHFHLNTIYWHSFGGSPEMARIIQSQGQILGISPKIWTWSPRRRQNLFAALNPDFTVLETDASIASELPRIFAEHVKGFLSEIGWEKTGFEHRQARHFQKINCWD